MLNFDAWFSPWTVLPFAAMLLLHGLFLRGACGAFNRSVDDNPSASIETPSYLRSLSILVLMFSFLVFVNWGMSNAMAQLDSESMNPIMSRLPTNYESQPLLEPEAALLATHTGLWAISGLMQFVFCALLMMYGFNIRYRQANVIAFLFAQRAALYSALLAVLGLIGAGVYLQRAQATGVPESPAAATDPGSTNQSISDESSEN